MRNTLAAVAVLTIVTGACASGGGGGGGSISSSGVAFGPAAAEYQPVLARSYQDMQIAAPAHAAIITVLTPTIEESKPVLFSVNYPQYDTDPRQFEIGRHRLVARQRTAADPPRCQGSARPSLSGCRPHLQTYPGVNIAATQSLSAEYAGNGTLLIVSERPVDPYEVAEALITRTRSRPTLAVAVRGDNASAAQRELEAVLGEILGTSAGKWAAHYQINR